MTATRINPSGFVVLESAAEFEQILSLNVSVGMPAGGILTWPDKKNMRVFFLTRKEAREAIKRTEHYRIAYGRTDLPEKANCRIEFIGAVEEQSKEQSNG